MIQWQDLHHSELTVQSLYALLKLRCEVFVVEQTCPYQDIDGDDLVGENRHILGWRDNELVAYARILKSEEEFDPVVIGRVIISGDRQPGGARRKAGLSADGKNAGRMPETVAGQGVIPGRAGAFAIILWPFWFYPGHGHLRRRWHPTHRHGARSETGAIARRCL